MIRWEDINNGYINTATDEVSDLGHMKLLEGREDSNDTVDKCADVYKDD